MNLTLSEVDKFFGAKSILKNISFIATTGMCIGVLGKNGAGKSTLFNIIANLLLPTRGIIKIDGQVMDGDYPLAIKRRIGALLNANPLIDEFTARQYLTYIAALYEIDDASSKVEDLLHTFFDEPLGSTLLRDFSTGMRQKISICSCLLHRPSLLILDEPFNALDVHAAQRLVDLIQHYAAHALIFISSHNLGYIEQTATHLLVLDEREIKYWGDIEQFRATQPLDQALLQEVQSVEKELLPIKWLI